MLNMQFKLLHKQFIKKAAETASDFIGYVTADKITKVSETVPQNTLETVPSETKKYDLMLKRQKKNEEK